MAKARVGNVTMLGFGDISFVPKTALDEMEKRAEVAEAVLADLLADLEGIEQPQLSIGKRVWVRRYDWGGPGMLNGNIVGVGRELTAVWVSYFSNGNQNYVVFIPTKDLLFSEESAKEGK